MSTRIVKKALKSSPAFAGAIMSAALIIGAAPVANAQSNALCGKRDEVIAQLQTVHGESRTSIGLQRNSQVMETYANQETGSWTIIVSMPTGVACLVAAGEAFQADEASAQNANTDDPA